MDFKEILAQMGVGVVVQFETSAIVTELQKLHDSNPNEFKSALQVEASEIGRIQKLLANSKSTILHSVVNGFDAAFKLAAANNGITL